MNKVFAQLIALSLVGCSPLIVRAAGQGAGSKNRAFTNADLNLYVDNTADDDDKCFAGLGTPPCRTIQGALNKVPKRLRHVVTITVAPGDYAGFVVEGFEVYPSASAGGAGMIIQGTSKDALPMTGKAAGTASFCNGGGVPDPNTHSTVMDPNQTWTRSDPKLRGRKLCLTSGKAQGECLAIEDNEETVITLAGYWSDFHRGWYNRFDDVNKISHGCEDGDMYKITEPDTHLNQAVSLPPGIGGQINGQARIDKMAAIIVSDVHGGASAAAGNAQPADNFQILIQDFDVLKENKDQVPVHSIAYVDSSDHVGFKHFTAGINGAPHPGLYAGSALFTFRNSTAWTVQSSYANGDAQTTSSSPMISCSRSATADTVIGVFGNVVDNMPAYFGDDVQDQTMCSSSVIFGGESIRNTGGDASGGSLGAITIGSAELVHFVGTKINGSRINPEPAACTQDSDCKPWNNPNPEPKCERVLNPPKDMPMLKQCTLPIPFSADCVRLGDSRRGGGGKAYFEGGDFSNCSLSGVNIAGNWNATFINVPTTSAAKPNFIPPNPDPKFVQREGWYNGIDGANKRFGIEAANGAKIEGLGCAANNVSPCANGGINSLRGKFDPLNLSFDNGATGFSYDQVQKAPGQTITDPQRGGLFSFGLGEATSPTSTVPPNWISFGQGVVYAFTSVPNTSYSVKDYDHVIGMSADAARTVTIPGKRPPGTHYIIIDTSGSVNSDHMITVTVVPPLGDTCTMTTCLISSQPKAVITPGADKALELISDGTNYWIISLK